MLHYKCLQAVLFNHIAKRLKGKKNDNSHLYKYENYDISKYIEVAEKLNIDVEPLDFGVYEFRKGNTVRRLTSSVGYDEQDPVSCKLCGNKYLTYKVLEKNGIKYFPKYKLYKFQDIRKSYDDFKQWDCPVVIKPCHGTTSGNGVTVNIKTVRELKKAIAQSFVFDRKNFLMEQYVEGSHFRILTLKGDYLACSQRIPARIVGNGRDSIKKLIEKENQKRSNDKSEGALYPIIINNEVRRKLKSIGKSMGSILSKNEEIFVKDTVNLSAGGEVRNIENVSVDIKSACEKIAGILDVYLAGFDFITSDISKPLSETDGVINEVNAAPSIDVMYKVTNYETHVDIADIILRDMFNF